MTSEYAEQYQKPEQRKPAGLKQFQDICREISTFFKTPTEPRFLDKFALMALEILGPYPDKLRRTLRFCVENQSSFPSIFDFKAAITQLPKRPVDHIANPVIDPRLKGCADCREKGLIRMLEVLSEREIYGYCSCALGEKLSTLGTQLMRKRSELEGRGFIKWSWK